MPAVAKSEDPDEMPHIAAFHQGLTMILNTAIKQNEPAYKILVFIISVNSLGSESASSSLRQI